MKDQCELEKKLRSLLQRWSCGVVAADEVHQLAESWLSEEEWVDLPRHDPRSAVYEVLAQLDILNQQLIVAADVPAFIHFLEAAKQDALGAWDSWERYWEGVDISARKKTLKDDPVYAC